MSCYECERKEKNGRSSALHVSAFTILEMMIYTAIVGLILVVVVYVTSTVYNVRARVTTSSIVHESILFAEDRILASLHSAKSVTTPASGTTSTLQLVMPDATRDPTMYSLVNGQIWVKEGTKANLPLTSAEVTISQLQFTRSAGTPPVIRMEIGGDLKNAKKSYSVPFSATTSASIHGN